MPRRLQTAMPEPPSTILSDEEIGRLFGVLLAELRTLSLTSARAAVAAAGITGVNAPAQYWDPFLAGVEGVFHKFGPEGRLAALRILADRFSASEKVCNLFAQHGYEYLDGTFVPTGMLDQREARFLPPSSASELAKAMKRLTDGDETGAITAACGAVDSLMQQLYSVNGLGDPGKVAFAAKVNTATKKLLIFENMQDQFVSLGIDPTHAQTIVTEMRNATNHAAQMLQTLRKTMGDVHGSKPALRRTSYESIKWASAICGLFE